MLVTIDPGVIPWVTPRGIRKMVFSLNPTASARIGCAPSVDSIRQSDPIETAGPFASMTIPATRDTMPYCLTTRVDSTRLSQWS